MEQPINIQELRRGMNELDVRLRLVGPKRDWRLVAALVVSIALNVVLWLWR